MSTRWDSQPRTRNAAPTVGGMLPFVVLALLLLGTWGCVAPRGVNVASDSSSLARVAMLEARVDSLAHELADLARARSALVDTTASSPAGGDTGAGSQSVVGVTNARCEALTQSGAQCKRNAEVGSLYCWQHQNAGASLNSSAPATTPEERTILTGPRGGKYYINSKGKKTYIRKKK